MIILFKKKRHTAKCKSSYMSTLDVEMSQGYWSSQRALKQLRRTLKTYGENCFLSISLSYLNFPKPFFKSKHKKYLAPAKACLRLSMQEKENASFAIHGFNCIVHAKSLHLYGKLIQLGKTSDFLMGVCHHLWAFLRWSLTPWYSTGSMRLCPIFIEVGSVNLICCLTAFV